LAIIDAFEEWRHLLEGIQHTTIVYTDHKNLEYFMNTRVLNRRQTRWSMSLSQFDFVITYRSGNLQEKLDALSRRSYLAPKEGDPILDQQKSIVLKPANFQLKALTMSSDEDASYLKEVQEALQDDPFIETIKKRLHTNEVNNEFEFKDGLLYFKGLFVHTSRAYTTQDNSNVPRPTYSWTFWLQQNHKIDITRFLVATNVETCEGIYTIMRHMYKRKGSMTSTIWPSSFAPSSKRSMVIVINGNYYKSATCRWKGFDFCGC
jgi:hypothetical protein